MARIPVFDLARGGPPPLPRALRLLASLDVEKLEVLRVEISTPNLFDRDPSRCEALTKNLGLTDVGETYGLLASLEFLLDRSRAWAEEGESPQTVIREFLISTKLLDNLADKADATLDRLGTLLSQEIDVERNRKRRWLRTGLLDTATSFASFIDLRPNFSPDRNEIEEVLPIVIFNVDVETEAGDDKSHVFQMSENGLLQLKKAVDDAKKKLSAIKRNEKLSPLLPK